MKKVTIGTVLLILTINSFCQEMNPQAPLTQNDYLKKSKTQKTVGFILLGAGAITLISVSGGNIDLGTVGALVIAGGAATLASIPLFITAGKNKRKAKNAAVSFQLQKSPVTLPVGISFRSSPAIRIKMNL